LYSIISCEDNQSQSPLLRPFQSGDTISYFCKVSIVTPLEILNRYWGHAAFRPRQEEIVLSVLNGNDTLALLPTGGGKSVCFQVPALCMEGVCLVVSPLMALMYDQVANLRERGISAVAITSAMNFREIDKTLDLCVQGKYKFLYVAPERLKSTLFKERFKRMMVSMIAVDESHCISQWGYDFRPSYLEIAAIREFHPTVPVLALTASATPAVVTDIQAKLHFKLENVIGTSFARPNLAYVVIEHENKEDKLLDILKNVPGSAVVYCGTRARTKEVAEFLYRRGHSATFYHAGLTHQEKDAAFKRWLRNESRIICATNAFGMGIDKPDVRVVVHMDVPSTPEAYFQEAGRAGRDGKKAYGVLLYNRGDLISLREKVEAKFPPIDTIRRVYQALGNNFQLAVGAGKDVQFEFNLAAFVKSFHLKAAETMHALNILEAAEYIALSDSIHMPSRCTISISKGDLYSFQVAHAQMDGFIKQLLRMYGGLFDNYVPIKESEIAKQIRTSDKEVISLLYLLQKQNVIDYIPATDTPKITYLTARESAEHLRLSKEVYEDRLKAETERMEGMIRYMQRDRCRSVQLLEYFGEKEPEACGKCDICRDRAKKGLETKQYEHLWEALSAQLLHTAPTLDEVDKLLPQFDSELLHKMIRWKLDHQELVLDDMLRLSLPGLDD
jgi:ATP-dependent DNA helicase RecQ